MPKPNPTLVVNPRSDSEFVALAHAILAEEGARATPYRLQGRLREQHPNAIVRSRELSAEATVVWYVYRDGRWTPDDRNVEPEGEGSR